ncbi:MAG: 16S rRNA (uracil(1498)-N(3))-methyltransferase [Bowdeniella nasicola]|nr:16S rRNA (uracil(1498)-N(3))-methyltransferase [Bowdeniella nasicola]
MSAPVFLDPALAEVRTGARLELTGEEARHAVAARRIRVGERVDVVNGAGLRVRGCVSAALKNPARLQIAVEEVIREAEPSPRLTLVQAIAKGGRDELAVQMATETGVDSILAWQADRCVARWGAKAERRRERWAGIASEAAKQARRAFRPEVAGPVTTAQLSDVIADGTLGDIVLLAHEEATHPISTVDLTGATSVAVLVGPEGGITPEEVNLLTGAGAQVVLLGPHVLRTSTAGPVAVAHLAERSGRWAT